METKLIAAEIATGAGVTTIITSSKQPSVIVDIFDYYAALKSTSLPTSGAASPVPSSQKPNEVDFDKLCASLGGSRPPHTIFTPSSIPMRDLKAWTSHTLYPAGSVIIDPGAYVVLSRRESGGRLLPAGVLGVRGSFASGQAVRILVRRRAEGSLAEGKEVAPLSYSNVAVAKMPCTPVLEPGVSLTTSVTPASLSRSVSSSSLAHAVTYDSHTVMDEETPLTYESDGWDCIEVGRGLANYNYAQISRVMGLNR